MDVADAAARVALFSGDGAGRGTCRRLMARLAAVVAKTLLRGAVLRDVPHCMRVGLNALKTAVKARTISTLKAPLPAELIRHSYFTKDLNLGRG